LAEGATAYAEELPARNFMLNIRNAITVFGGEQGLSNLTGLSKPVFQKWRHGRGVPQLPALLCLSHCFDVPMIHWFSRLIPEATLRQGKSVPSGIRIFQISLSHPPRHVIQDAILASLAHATDNPPSVARLAKMLGSTPGHLYWHHPGLIRKVVQRRALAARRRKERTVERRLHIVRQAIAELQSKGRPLSCRAVLIRINHRVSWDLHAMVRREIDMCSANQRIPLTPAA
jgi:hypothetical protein